MISIQVCDAHEKEVTDMVTQLPGAIERLIHRGGPRGHGHTPIEVAKAAKACELIEWQELLPKTPLRPGYEDTRMHYFDIPEVTGTHVRVNYYPDGGVARLRLWAMDAPQLAPKPTPLYLPITTGKICTVVPHSSTCEEKMPSQIPYDYPELSSIDMGGRGVACSNHHYGEPQNLLQPNLGKDMGDGWETARHPERPVILHKHPDTGLVDSDLMDWSIIQLGAVAAFGVARVVLDTKHFRGNYPESVQVEGSFVERAGLPDNQLSMQANWFPLVKRTRMAPDAEHVFDRDLNQIENGHRAVSHVRVSVYPDGGLSRVRIYGQPSMDEMTTTDMLHSHL
jgi:allantoicase